MASDEARWITREGKALPATGAQLHGAQCNGAEEASGVEAAGAGARDRSGAVLRGRWGEKGLPA